MSMAGLTMICDLIPKKNLCKIMVKIIRLWKQYSVAGGESIEMVLVDSSGDKIHGSVKNQLVSQFEDTLQEGGSRVISNIAVTISCGSYRTSKHPYKILFHAKTRVRNCEALPHKITGFHPVNFKSLVYGKEDADILVDVIGQIVEASHLEVVVVHGKDTQKLSLEIRNQEDERLPLILWGKFAKDINDAIVSVGYLPLILLLRFGKIKKWKGEHSVSNAYNVSDVLLNPDMDEVQDFLSLLPKDGFCLQRSKPLISVGSVAEIDDERIPTPKKTVAEIKASIQVEKCIVMCTISGIDSDMGWYYLSCKVCSKKVQPVMSEVAAIVNDVEAFTLKYFCVKCNSYSPTLLPRYKLHLVVLDSTSDTKFVLFDNLATQLIGQPCLELTGPMSDVMEEPVALPEAITNLFGRTYLFKIGIERENYQYKVDTFKVLKIIDVNQNLEE